jgi:hypothetical protein
LEGVNWLLWNFWNKRSCILADEMVGCLYGVMSFDSAYLYLLLQTLLSLSSFFTRF